MKTSNLHTPKVEIHTRQQLFHFGCYDAKTRLFCLKCFVPVTLAGMFIWKNFHPGYRVLGRKNKASSVNRAYMKRTYIFLIIITNDRVEVEVVVEVLRGLMTQG